MDQGKGFHPGLRVVEGALLFFFQSLPGKTRRYLAASSGTFSFFFCFGQAQMIFQELGDQSGREAQNSASSSNFEW